MFLVVCVISACTCVCWLPRYVPGFLEVLKFGWVQYYAIGAIVWSAPLSVHENRIPSAASQRFFIGLFRNSVFDFQIADTLVEDERHPDSSSGFDVVHPHEH